MIIKKITLENFLCYYDIKEFELSDGLNIILGENGEGKTKLFEAIEWLFNGDNRNLELLVSAKAIDEADIDSQFRVRVGITVEQYEEKKTISKSFLVKKLNKADVSISNYLIEGIEENKKGERSPVDGKFLLDQVFPPVIRRYSMFKGEAQLNIFQNEDALITLINSFSDAKHYEKYAQKGTFLKDKAEKAVQEATSSQTRNQQDYKKAESENISIGEGAEALLVHINTTEDQIEKTDANIEEADKYVSNAEALETINTRIKKIETDISVVSGRIKETYTTDLFDERWILVNFENIHHQYSSKINELGIKRRELQSKYDKEQGIKEGKKQAAVELINNAIPLPIGVPSKAHMEEMLQHQLCKVCNRPAKKGSEAYNFMLKRLQGYIDAQKPILLTEEENERPLFCCNYTNRLSSMVVSYEDELGDLRLIRNKIKERFDFNTKRREELKSFEDSHANEISEREAIIGSSSIGADKLTNVLKNYNAWQRNKGTLNRELADYKLALDNIDVELKEWQGYKDSIDTKSANTFLIKTRTILRDIETIFKDTKERKFDEFIALLQTKSNTFFDSINIDSFTGNIIFTKRKSSGEKIIVRIELQEADGKVVHKPNQSLETSMHIAILFAISELAAELRTENFPLIFDAPTSSFGETKSTQFLNLISETENQKILLIKDFLETNSQTKTLAVKSEFASVKRNKAFWIYLERPFDKKVLKTLNTKIINL